MKISFAECCTCISNWENGAASFFNNAPNECNAFWKESQLESNLFEGFSIKFNKGFDISEDSLNSFISKKIDNNMIFVNGLCQVLEMNSLFLASVECVVDVNTCTSLLATRSFCCGETFSNNSLLYCNNPLVDFLSLLFYVIIS